MKITVKRGAFVSAFSDVMPFIPAKAVMPILKNAKITVKGNRLKIEANNAQDSISRYMEVEAADAEDSFCVSAADFGKYITALKGDTIDIETDGDEVTVKHSKGTGDFQSVPSDEFPAFKMPEDSVTITIPSAVLGEAVSTASVFAATETLRPMMCAIYAYVKEGKFGYAASDTHKMIHGFHDGFENINEVNWYIMPTAFKPLAKACKAYSGDVTIRISEGKVSYRLGDTAIFTVQTQGKYPDFNRVIPKEWVMDFNVERDDMQDSLRRMLMFCDDSQCVRLNVSPMDIVLKVDNLAAVKRGSEAIVHGGCAGEMTIGVNGQYMLDALTAFAPGEIRMCLTEASRPMVIRQASKPNVTTIVMPMVIAEQ